VSVDVLAEARAAVEQYVVHFGDEAAAVAPLHGQLQDDDRILERSNMRGHVTTSALVLDAALTHALVIHHRVFDVWLQPGGHYEPPGSLWDSACREVAEETGLTAMRPYPWSSPRTRGPSVVPLDIDTHPIPARAAKSEADHRHHDLAYLAVTDRDFVPTAQVEEVHDVQWVALDLLTRYPNARLRRLASKAVAMVRARPPSAGRSTA